MKQFLFVFLCWIGLYSNAQTIGIENDSRIYNQFIIQLKTGYTIKDVTATFSSLTIKQNLSKRMNIWLVERNTTTDAEDFLQTLNTNGAVSKAQFNHRIQQRAIVPNDTFFSLQWDLLNTGQNGGAAGDDIDATDAWGIDHSNLTINGDTIVVAVIDVGFDITHEDLNFFRNYHEIPDNGIDDDGNGYIDDFEGWNVYDTSGHVNSLGTDPHSMHISGVIGAIGNNKIGIAGECWGVKVLRICGSSTDESQVVAAYDYVITMRSIYNNTAGAKGAYIVSTNTSFGVDYGNPVDFPIWCAMYDSMGAVGILSAAATTNNSVNVDINHDMPSGCPSNWMIGVTNTNDRNNIRGGYGQNSIDLGAPGTGIFSTISNNSYGYMTGTSMATPHVAGAIAAMYAAACPKLIDDYAAYPDSIALIVKQMLFDGVTPASSTYSKTGTGGILNLYRAVNNLKEYNCNNCSEALTTNIVQPTCSNTCDGSVQISLTSNNTVIYSAQNLCYGYYNITVDTPGCAQYRNVTLIQPDTIVISGFTIIVPSGDTPGNIIVYASAGNYQLEYSLDGVNYQPTSTFSIPTIGNYTIYVQSETGCIIQQQVVVNALKDISGLNEWNLYPNPATDILNVSVSVNVDLQIQLNVTNILGDILIQQTKEFTSGLHQFSFSTSSLPNGIYFLELKEQGSSTTKKFIVAK